MRKIQLHCLLLLLVSLFSGHVFAGAPEKVEVFVSIPPQKWIGEQIGKELVNIHVLVDKGQEPHVFEPRPRQILALSRAALFFGVDLEFEHVIRGRLEMTSPHLRMVDTTAGVKRIPMQADSHGHGATLDPHVWLSPENMKSMAASMTKALAYEDPQHRRDYEANLAELNRKLDALDQEIAERLAPFAGASFFVFHPAFGYFAHSYKLHQEAVETGGKSPTPKVLSALINKARAKGVKVIFVQPQFDPKSASVVAAAIGGKVVPLNPLAEDVGENLKIMADRIAQALESREQK